MGCCRRSMRMRSMERARLGGAQNPALQCSTTGSSSLPSGNVSDDGLRDGVQQSVQQHLSG